MTLSLLHREFVVIALLENGKNGFINELVDVRQIKYKLMRETTCVASKTRETRVSHANSPIWFLGLFRFHLTLATVYTTSTNHKQETMTRLEYNGHRRETGNRDDKRFKQNNIISTRFRM